ncbi:DUF4357 domain-containing protein [Chloroflexota bacterium]
MRTGEAQTVTDGKMLYCKIKGPTATGKRSPSGFVVFKDSQAALWHRPSAKHIRKIREKLINFGKLILRAGHLSFTSDIEFGIPSTAGGVIRGGNTNGFTQWNNSKGRSLKEIEKGKL